MSHFAYTRAGGVWADGVVLAAELADLDAKTFAALNGDGGGVWAPSSKIEVGGQGFKFTGALHELTGTLTVKSGGTLTIDPGASVVMGGALAVSNVLTITSAGALLVDAGASVTFNANATFNGTTTFTGNLNLGNNALDSHTLQGIFAITAGILDCQVPASFQHNVSIGDSAGDAHSITGVLTCNDPIILAGDARVRERIVQLADSNATISPATADIYYMPGGGTVQTANRTLTLSSTGLAAGDSVTVTTDEGAFQLTVTDGAGFSYVLKNLGTFFPSAKFVRTASSWFVVRYGSN